jgi:hypothetical protein
MGALGFSLGMPGFSSGASLQDSGAMNTPVAVVAGNQGAGSSIVDMIEAVAGLQGVQSAPAASVNASPSLFGSSGGIPTWLWLAAAAVAVLLLVKGRR